MIKHIYSDGSVGEEHEVGDRVETTRLIFYGWDKPQKSIPIGTQGVVKWLKPYDKTSTYHTTFAAVNLESYGMESILNSGLKSLEVARKEVKVAKVAKEGDLA
jgi:hypothetical protein